MLKPVSFTKRCYAIFLILLLSACGGAENETYQAQFYVFGTLVEITVAGAPREKAARVAGDLGRRFQTMHNHWHAWEPGPLMDVNKAFAEGRRVPAAAGLRELIQISQEFSARSEGLFNPAVSRLIALWGFHAAKEQWRPPEQAAVQALLEQAPSMRDITIHPDGTVESSNPAVQLDFGAVGKGYAVDLALAELRRQGLPNAIVNAGGNLRVSGNNAGHPWRIGIRGADGKGVLAALDAADGEAVFTSGNYERYHEFEGKRYAHIIDPRSGMPVDNTTSVTVIHNNGAAADAASTALSIAGPDEWPRIAKQMEICCVLLVDKTGTVYMNPAMAKRVKFLGKRPERVEIKTW